MLDPELSSSSIVLAGAFNPRIFTPAWFSRQNLLSANEADQADTKIVHPEISHFETESFVVHVTTERFTAVTRPSAHWVVLKDLVLGTFYVLEHTPIKAIGLNRMMHFRLGSEEQWHRFGDRVTPKEGWAGILGGRPGMASAEILAEKRDAPGVKLSVKVQPSVQVRPFGVYFETNEHYETPNEDGLSLALTKLREGWEESQQYANEIADHILNWTERN